MDKILVPMTQDEYLQYIAKVSSEDVLKSYLEELGRISNDLMLPMLQGRSVVIPYEDFWKLNKQYLGGK